MINIMLYNYKTILHRENATFCNVGNMAPSIGHNFIDFRIQQDMIYVYSVKLSIFFNKMIYCKTTILLFTPLIYA